MIEPMYEPENQSFTDTISIYPVLDVTKLIYSREGILFSSTFSEKEPFFSWIYHLPHE